MRPHPTLSAVLLLAVVVAAFYLLGETSEERFCPVVRRLADALELSPSAAGVTLLALGNGAPDVFACLAAFSASGGGGGGSRGGTLSAVPGGDVGGGMIGATLRRVCVSPWSPYDPVRAVHAVPRGLYFPAAFLSAQGHSLSIPTTRLDGLQLRLTYP